MTTTSAPAATPADAPHPVTCRTCGESVVWQDDIDAMADGDCGDCQDDPAHAHRAAALAAVTTTRAVRFANAMREHGLILTDMDMVAVAVHRADMIDRIGAAPAGSLARVAHRVSAAARTVFPDYDDLPATSATRGLIRHMVSDALRAAAA